MSFKLLLVITLFVAFAAVFIQADNVVSDISSALNAVLQPLLNLVVRILNVVLDLLNGTLQPNGLLTIVVDLLTQLLNFLGVELGGRSPSGSTPAPVGGLLGSVVGLVEILLKVVIGIVDVLLNLLTGVLTVVDIPITLVNTISSFIGSILSGINGIAGR
ncbi:hypothetical protein L596_029048 [Steinernema carpocapsae]|uniref:SXP/RAL-2 family protein Ani s 5-like cation-binding domain-containing protein n=1 Tax=Steinernema carpocapsae TaxID=34508 RepID=A0A4U5LTH1_STECR|nr:hypothetical protein L596_029048 [Steinernema carpocapsae]